MNHSLISGLIPGCSSGSWLENIYIANVQSVPVAFPLLLCGKNDVFLLLLNRKSLDSLELGSVVVGHPVFSHSECASPVSYGKGKTAPLNIHSGIQNW